MKTKITNGALELFIRYGVKNITMDEIANHLVISKKTIYQHFSDKDNLVLCATQNYLKQEKIELDQIRNESKDAVEEMFKICLYIERKITNMHPSVLFDLQKFYIDAWREYENHKNYLYTYFHSNMEWGIKEGVYRSDVNIRILSILRLHEIQLAFDPSLYSPTEFGLRDVFIALLEHFLYGVISEKGILLYKEYTKRV